MMAKRHEPTPFSKDKASELKGREGSAKKIYRRRERVTKKLLIKGIP